MRRVILLIILGMTLGSFSLLRATAQNDTPSIQLGENTLGEITIDDPAPLFSLFAEKDTPFTLQAQSLTSNLAPMILVYDAQNRLFARERNTLGAAQAVLTFRPLPNTSYTVQILSHDGETGQFVLSLSAGDVTQPSISELRSGQEIQDFVSPEKPIKRYQVTSSPQEALLVQVTSLLPDGGPGVILSSDSGEPLGTTRQNLLGGAFFIPAGAPTPYQLMVVHSGADRVERYNLSVLPFRSDTPVTSALDTAATSNPTAASANAQDAFNAAQTSQAPAAEATSAPVTPTTPPLVIIPDDAECSVTPQSPDQGVNVRRGPSQQYETIAALQVGEVMIVTGRSADSQWWQVEYKLLQYGWVAGGVVRRGGDCSDIGVAEFPPLEDNN